MIDLNEENKEFLTFKIIQSGDIKKVTLTPDNLKKDFRDIIQTLLKELKLKQKDTFISNEEGRMIGIHDFSLSLKDVIQKFGTMLKVYSEKVF